VNYVKTYLDGLTITEVLVLRNDKKQALEDMEDTNRSIAVYRDEGRSPRTSAHFMLHCRSASLAPQGLYRPINDKRGLHVRLACPKMYCIPVGFYYAKWLEKLDYYYLRNSLQRERSSSTRTSLTPTPTPIKQTPSSERQTLMEKRAAIFEVSEYGCYGLTTLSVRYSSTGSRHATVLL
jgi:hypothetical protein